MHGWLLISFGIVAIFFISIKMSTFLLFPFQSLVSLFVWKWSLMLWNLVEIDENSMKYSYLIAISSCNWIDKSFLLAQSILIGQVYLLMTSEFSESSESLSIFWLFSFLPAYFHINDFTWYLENIPMNVDCINGMRQMIFYWVSGMLKQPELMQRKTNFNAT